MIWMDVDTALGEVPVNLVPLTDDTDFKTIETAVAYNAAGLALYWHFVTTAGVETTTQVTPTTAGVYDWAHAGQGMYTIEIPASGGGSINNDTEGFGYFTGVATGVLPWRGPTIGFRAAGLNNLLVDDAHSATRGLAGTALPAAAADAAGGLPISDAGGLDIDARLDAAVSSRAVAGDAMALTSGERTTLAAAIWNALTSGMTTAGSIGKKLADWVVGTIDTYTGNTKQTGDNYARLGSPAGASVSADIAAVKTDTGNLVTRITSTLFAGITSLAEWLGLIAGKQVADATALAEIKATGAGSGTYNEATDSLEALRDRGDAAWTTGGGASITDILNVHAVIPFSIDLANTATVRLGLMLTNALDDLPSTAEITPGTIDIDRKAIGGTSWSAVVTDAACSEQAGMVYYDEVFDAGSGYAAGDSIRVTFKSQKITVAANDYEVTDANGVMFQTHIREAMRGTDSAALATALATAQLDLDTLTGTDGATLATSQPNYAPSKAGDLMGLAAGAITAAKFAANAIDANALAADAVAEIQAGLSTLTASGVWAAATRTLSSNANLNDPTAAAIATAVLAEAITELAAVPGASPTLRQAMALLYMALRNKVTVDATAKTIHNDAGTALGAKSLTDDSTTYTEAKLA